MHKILRLFQHLITLTASFLTVSVHRDLGVLVDSRLKFHEHIKEVVRKKEGWLASCCVQLCVVTQFSWCPCSSTDNR